MAMVWVAVSEPRPHSTHHSTTPPHLSGRAGGVQRRERLVVPRAHDARLVGRARVRERRLGLAAPVRARAPQQRREPLRVARCGRVEDEPLAVGELAEGST